MSPLFTASYIVLATLLAWEVLTVHKILRKAAETRIAREQHRREVESRTLSRIPSFRSKLFGTDGFLTAFDIQGKSTALLFVDQDVESRRSMLDMQSLLERIHKDRHILLFVCTRRNDMSANIAHLLSLAGPFSSHRLSAIYDRDFVAARQFQIGAYPTLLLAGPDGSVQRTWTSVHTCLGRIKELADPTPAGLLAAQPSTEAGI